MGGDGCWCLSWCFSQSTSVYLLEKIVRLDYEKLISVGPRSLLGRIGTLFYHLRVDNFEQIPPKDTFQMSQLKIAIGQKTFSLLFQYSGFIGIQKLSEHINICIINVTLVESVSIQTCLHISCLLLTSIPAISHLVCNQCLCVGNGRRETLTKTMYLMLKRGWFKCQHIKRCPCENEWGPQIF